MSTDLPWPEDADRVQSRLRGLVGSVVLPSELEDFRLEWVTPPPDPSRAAQNWVVLRLTVVAVGEVVQYTVWGPDWPSDWERALEDLSDRLEDWVCETRFAWGQQRVASIPD